VPPRRARAESPPPAARPAPGPRFDLRSRLRKDWNTIRRGIEAGEEDFWRVVDDTRRKVRRIVGE
jgi:hypothetical protein